MSRKQLFGVSLLVVSLCIFASTSSQAVSLIWDPGLTGGGGGGGAGSWDEVTAPIPANWFDTISGLDVVWTPGGDADFNNVGGIVAVDAGGVNVHDINFNVTDYVITGSTITIQGASPAIYTVDGTSEIQSVIADLPSPGPGSGFEKTGPGTLFINNNAAGSTVANTYTGKTIITGGTLAIRSDSSLGAIPSVLTTDQITINDGAKLMLMNKFDIAGGNRGVTIHGNATIETSTAGQCKINASITGDGMLVKEGASDLSLRGTNNFTGGIWIKEGSISTGQGGANIPILPNLKLETGTVMDLNKVNISVGRLTGTGTVLQYNTNVMRTVSIGYGDVTETFDGNFGTTGYSGRVSIDKIGAGTYTLNGDIAGSTYDSRIKVSGGTLVLKNTVNIGNWHVYNAVGGVLDVSDYTSFTVKSGEIMAGSVAGSVEGNVLIQGYASPGGGDITGTTLSGGIGTLNVEDINFDAGGKYYAELSGASVSDLLNVTGAGTLTINSGASLNVAFKSFTPTASDFGTTWDILNWVSKSGTWTPGNIALPDVSSIGGNWDTSNLENNGTLTLVPEPSSLILLAMGALLMLLRWKRR